MNRGRGRGHGTARGRGQQQTWRSVSADSSAGRQSHGRADPSSDGHVYSSNRKSYSSPQARGRGPSGDVSEHHENVTPPGRGRGWSTFSGESYSYGGRGKQQWRASSKAGSGSDLRHDKKVGSSSGGNGVSHPAGEVSLPSSLDLNQSFVEDIDNLTDVSRVLEQSDVGNCGSEVKVFESAEDLCDNENSESSIPIEHFDICPPKSGSVVTLKASLLATNREKRNEMKRSVGGRTILRSGMVLLKNYLSSREQANILKICRRHGLGPAGFYQPRFRDGGKLHLRLMCFGAFWDPETNKYGELRPMDGAKPPPVPPEFLQLVDRAIKDSHSLIAEDSRVKNVENILPPVKPDICLVNYYASTGRLGLHQDKDESRESLDKGIPIVSFSIGESAEFLYGDERDAEKADKVILDSGDVLIFGGKSRHIFHGVSKIVPDTAPKTLLEETDFRAGRLNLTFRQYI